MQHRCSIDMLFAKPSFQAPKLPVRENDVGQVFVANLTSLPIESVDEFDDIYSFVLLPSLLRN